LKNEFLLSRPADLEQAREIVKESVAIYNHERPHLALKYKTPDCKMASESIAVWHSNRS
ncbi:integrase core domain-containing protein, partial [Salmonella enterica]